MVFVWVGTVGWRAGTDGATPTPPRVEVTRAAKGDIYGLRTVDAPLTEVVAALGRALGCAVEIPEKLGRQRLTLDLPPRPPERLLRLLARRCDATLSVRYRLAPDEGKCAVRGEGRPNPPTPFPKGKGEEEPVSPLPFREGGPGGLGLPSHELRATSYELPRRGTPLLATQPVVLEIARPIELRRALQQLDAPVEVADGIDGRVRIFAARVPLSRVLDQLAAQTGCEWCAIVSLARHEPSDAAGAEEERAQRYYAGIAALSSPERHEELTAELDAMERLSPEARSSAIERVAADLGSLATRIEQTPIEHRDGVVANVREILADFSNVLSRLPLDRQRRMAPVFQALDALATWMASLE